MAQTDRYILASALLGGAIGGFALGYFLGNNNDTGSAKRRKLLQNEPLYLCLAGDRSGVGKTTCSLALIMSFVEKGYAPEEIAYIKPCTQCVSVQIVAKWCEMKGIEHISIGPVVYKKGYTYQAIAEEEETFENRMDRVIESIISIGKGKKIVLVDGVGYASVGSCCGVSNGQFASRLGAPTLLISTSGCGDAIDRGNLNIAYYKQEKAEVLGIMYNVKEKNPRHSIPNSEKYITQFYSKTNPSLNIYGWLPPIENLNKQEATGCATVVPKDLFIDKLTEEESKFCEDLKNNFLKYIEVDYILQDLKNFYGQ